MLDKISVNSKEALRDRLRNAAEVANLSSISQKEGKIKKRYASGTEDREPYLQEVRFLCQAVMPYLYPPEGTVHVFDTPAANQSVVARGVINLTQKLSSTILPSDGNFFNNQVLPGYAKWAVEQQVQAGGDPEEVTTVITQVNNRLINRDAHIRQAIKSSNDAETNYQTVLHAIVAGASVFLKASKEVSKMYTLESFVWWFDDSGECVDLIVVDKLHVSKFDPKILKRIAGTDNLESFEEANLTELPVYTRQVRRFDHWELQVECLGERIKEMEGKEPLDAPRFIAFPFFVHPGKNYPISYLSMNKGDIFQFENLNLSLNKMTEIACKAIFAVDPMTRQTEEELKKFLTQEGGFQVMFTDPTRKPEMIFANIAGNYQAVTALFEQARQTLMQLFLMEQSVVRNAERVTKEEIKTVMQGLQSLLGGIYLSIARRFQRPYVRRIELDLEKAGEIEPLDRSIAEMVLTAGLATLEKAEQKQALMEWGQILQTLIGPEALAGKLNIDEYGTRMGNYSDIVMESLLLSDEQQQEKQGITQLVETAKSLGPNGPQMLSQVLANLPSLMQVAGQTGLVPGMDAQASESPTTGGDESVPEA